MFDWLRKPPTENTSLFFETLLFVVGIIALLGAVYVLIYHYDDIPEYRTFGGYERTAILEPFLPAAALLSISRILQNRRRNRYDVILPNVKAEKKRKYTWKL